MNIRDSYEIVLSQMTGSVESEDHGIHDIPSSEANCFNRPTILTFGGNDSIKQITMRGNAKRATRLGGVVGYENIGVFGARYNRLSPFTYAIEFNNGFKNSKGNYGKGAYQFALSHIMPRLTGQDGNRLDITTAKKHMRNLNIFAISFGSIVAEEVGNALYEQMQELHYTEAEIKEITAQVLLVTVGGIAQAGKGRANFNRICIMHQRDEALGDERFYSSITDTNSFYLRSQLSWAEKLGSEIAILKGNFGETIIAVNHDLNHYPRMDREGHFFKDAITESAHEIVDPEHHHPDLFVNPGIGKYGFFLPTVISNILSTAIENSVVNYCESAQFIPLPPVDEMIKNSRIRADSTITRKLLSNYGEYTNFQTRLKEAFVAPLGLSK